MEPEPQLNPSEPNEDPGGVPRTFAIEEPGNPDRRWRLQIRPGDLALFHDEDPQPYVILREQMQKDVVLIEGMRVLAVNKPKKATFRLPPEAVSAVADWIGTPLLAAHYLKRRYSWVLPVAFIWILGSLPMPGDPDSSRDPMPLDMFGMVLGFALLVSWGVAKWRPNPVLFLVDSIWFLCLAGYLSYDVWHGRSMLWMILVGLLLWMALTGINHFRRFKGTAMTGVKL